MKAHHQSAQAANNMPRVFINGRFTTQPMTGLQRYGAETTKRLLASGCTTGSDFLSVRLIVPDRKLTGPGPRTIWEQATLLSQSLNGVLFSPCNAGPLFHPNHLVAIHDVRASDAKWNSSIPPRTRLYSQVSLRVLSRTARQFLTVSHYSKARIKKVYNIADDKITVVYPGADHILDTPPDFDVLSKLDLKPYKYVLAVNSLLPHKNTAILHSINWAHYGIRLCVVGTVPQANFSPFPLLADSNIVYAGRVSDAEIRALYANALVYIFPSLYEGFGFPPLEAMYCGCPVIASDRASIPEVCGEGALYFDPHSSASLDSTIQMILTEPRLREEMICRGHERARLFQWNTCAKMIATLLVQMAT